MRDGKRDFLIDLVAVLGTWDLGSCCWVLAGEIVRVGRENERLLVDEMELIDDGSWTVLRPGLGQDFLVDLKGVATGWVLGITAKREAAGLLVMLSNDGSAENS